MKKSVKATKPAKKSVPKKAAAKKAAPKKLSVKKAPAKKQTAKKPVAKRAALRKVASNAAPESEGRVVVENVNVPGYKTTVDAGKYEAMRSVMMRVLPKAPGGLTQAEMFTAVTGKLPESLFPGQVKAGWWAKSVQLDLEAKGVMKRTATKPLRWYRA